MNKTLLIGLTLPTILLSSCGGASPRTLPQTAPATEPLVLVTESPPTIETLAATPDPTTEAPITGPSFANDVMPIFAANCAKCHGIDGIKAGLDMRTYETIIGGSFNGPQIVPGDAATSYLVQSVTDGKMAEHRTKLTAEQIQIITDWLNAGALNN